jgi:phage shock protein PspC (stress-responsive transcriptional regulator)
MTETTFTRYRLERPYDAPFRGVCTAVADATGTDPVLWRVLVVVSTFFGGLGVALYLLGIVLIPREGETRSVGDRLLHGPDRHLDRGQLVLVIALIIATASLLHDSDGLIAATVIGVLALLWWRGRSDQPTPAPFAAPAGAPVVLDKPLPSRPPREPRRRSPFTGLTASVAALTAGVLVLVGTGTSTSVPAEVVLASALGVTGLGLVIGSFWGRSTGLVLLATLLGLGLAATVAVRPVVDDGVGDRTWLPSSSETHQSYRLGVGDATLDLTGLTPQEARTISVDAHVVVGHLLVIVPEGLRVSLSAKAGLGDLDIEGKDYNGRNVSHSADLGPSGTPQVRLALSVRTGQVEVRHA